MAGSGMDNLNSSIGQFNSTLERTKNSISGIVQEITTFADAMRGGVSSTSGGSSAVPQGSSAATPRFSAPSSASGIGSGITNFLASIPAVMGAALGSPASIASYQLGTSAQRSLLINLTELTLPARCRCLLAEQLIALLMP